MHERQSLDDAASSAGGAIIFLLEIAKSRHVQIEQHVSTLSEMKMHIISCEILVVVVVDSSGGGGSSGGSGSSGSR